MQKQKEKCNKPPRTPTIINSWIALLCYTLPTLPFPCYFEANTQYTPFIRIF